MIYSALASMSLYILWDKSWLWDTREMWEGWPRQPMSRDVSLLYTVQISFYLTQTLAMVLFNDRDWKDRNVLLLHHIITLMLLLTSHLMGFFRVGSMVLLVHDFADPLIMASKVLFDIGRVRAAETVYGFAFTFWVISRNLLFPFIVLRSLVFESLDNQMISFWSGLWWYNFVLLSTLGMFHLFWTYLFSKMLLQKLMQGEVTSDEFNPDSSDESGEDDEKDKIERDGGNNLDGGGEGVKAKN